MSTERDVVGPVLESSELGRAVLRAIQSLNQDVEVMDRGSYLRVHTTRRCIVTRQAIEAELGRPFLLPSDLELTMPSFRGRLMIDAEQAVWEVQT
ncbi:MAG TPA: MmoB/DmpM family protein [Polyangiaceae bacterium]|nr:MmoB/DmpM family protein [Polyangiaceae bacterium]